MLSTLLGCNGKGRRSGDDFYTVEYMTELEALRTVFPDASRVVYDAVKLTREETIQVEKLLGSRVGARDFRSFVAVDEEGKLDGYAFIHNELGKFKYITFIVCVTPEGVARKVAILVYRESRGGEVARKRFLAQYEGKTLDDPIRASFDIVNIVGATMSVTSLNHGVKKILAVVDTVYRRDPKRLQRALEEGEAIEQFKTASAATNSNAPSASPQLYRESQLKFGNSLCEIEIWDHDRDRARRACHAAFAEIDRLQSLLSDYDPNSDLSRISRASGKELVPIAPTTADFLKVAQKISRATHGAFDATVGALVDAWGFRSASPHKPKKSELRELRRRVDHHAVELVRLEDGSHGARLARAGMRLDPGGLGKGFAVDRVVEILRREGIDNALVNFSGNIFALGSPPREPGWTVAVRDPALPDRILGTVLLRDEAISSSGGYERFIEIDGEKLSHILSPVTLRPVENDVGAVVRAPNATLADGWSTAASVLQEEAISLLETESGIAALVTHSGQTWNSTTWRVEPTDLD